MIAGSAVLGAGLRPVPEAVDPQPLSDEAKVAEYLELMGKQSASRAQSSAGEVMAKIDVIEEVTSENWGSTVAQCYRDAGFEVTGDSASGWGITSGPTATATEAAQFVDQVGMFPRWSPYYFAESESFVGAEGERLERSCPSQAPWQRDASGFAPFG